MSAPSPDPRLTKRQQLGERSRGEILDAALRLMSEQGYDGASIAKIARASGLPASSIYWHFGSKSGVLAAVMERGADAFFTSSLEGLDDMDETTEPLEILRRSFGQARQAAEQHPEFLRLLFLLILAERADERVAEVVARANERGRAQLHEQIKRAFSRYGRAMASRIADELTVTAFVVFNGAYLTVQSNAGLELAPLIEVMAESVLLFAQRIIDA